VLSSVGAIAVVGASACLLERGSAAPSDAPPVAETEATHPPGVEDLLWGGVSYDVRHLDKERFLRVMRLCWGKTIEGRPDLAGFARVDLQIDDAGHVVDGSIGVMVFRDRFMGDEDTQAAAIFLDCAEGRYDAMKVPPATAERGTLSFDVRLLPARP